MSYNNLFEDPLDSEDFDAVKYINQRFPTGKVVSYHIVCAAEMVDCPPKVISAHLPSPPMSRH